MPRINGRNKGANEIWKAVISPFSFELHKYEVSNLGRVRYGIGYGSLRVQPGTMVNPGLDDKGYLQVCWADVDGIRHTIKVARLVMLAFEGPRPKGMTIDHKDEEKLNNAYSNLHYITRSANSAKNKGTFKYKAKWLSLKAIHAKHCIEELPYLSFKRRVDRGWEIERALTTPLMKPGRPYK